MLDEERLDDGDDYRRLLRGIVPAAVLADAFCAVADIGQFLAVQVAY